MKKFKLLSMMAMLVLSSMFFVACEEEDNPLDPTAPLPNAPTELRATSLSATAVKLMWNASTSKDSSWFKGYELTITGGTPIASKAIGKVTEYEVTGLEAGVVYTFTLKAVNTDDATSTGSTTVQWSPAARFETADIKMYSFESSFGSGLSLYDETNKKPMNLKATDRVKWHLGLDDRTNGALYFGPASSIDIGTGTPTAEVEIADDYWEGNSLNTVFEKVSLSSLTFIKSRINLLQLDNNTTGLIFVLRIKQQGATNWNYAKVLIERGSGGFLQGTGNDKYIQMKVSYQTTAGVPYAKISE